jgi:penicillin amidase
MRQCAIHRPRYRRLWRLPSVSVFGTAAVAVLAAIASSAVFGPWWSPVAVLVLGVCGIAAYASRRRARIAVEFRMARALLASTMDCPGDIEVAGLSASVRAETMPDGVTRIDADTWLDAVRALGYVTARDRGFQMELMRRTAYGRLAEVWGRTAVPSDQRFRPLGLARAAERAAAALAEPERDLVTAFSAGVDAAFTEHGAPFESRFLSYRPLPWTVEDSLAVVLYLFHGLSWNEPAKRADAVLRQALPDDVARFFLPDDTGAEPPLPPDLARLRGAAHPGVIELDSAVAGSNCWVTLGKDGAMLACDLHLPLTMPNLLYEVDLRWPDGRVRGLTAPGVPAVLTGSNGHLAWGVTNLTADVLDLVPAGEDLTTATEHIRVRGGGQIAVDVTHDGTRPVAAEKLLGNTVAIRWTGHDPRAGDLKFQRLANAGSVEEGVKVLEDADGIALNVLLADATGRMAHLATGLLPTRPADAPDRADGHLDGVRRPKRVDPEQGLLVSANDGALPQLPFRYGYNLDPGHRAMRARQVLAETPEPGPAALRDLQHDVDAAVYLPYRDLAVSALTDRGDTADVRAVLRDWDGLASTRSRALPVLVRLRDILAQHVLAPYFSACRDHDPAFRYPFRTVDRPLLAILRAGDPTLLPDDEPCDRLVARSVIEAMADLRAVTGKSLPEWGVLNSVGLTHPFAGLAPWASRLLGVVPRPEPGSLHSVRACVPGFAAVGRVVLVPGADGATVVETPGGQSGHPLSRHFDDRHERWSSTVPGAMRPPPAPGTGCAFVLRPKESAG